MADGITAGFGKPFAEQMAALRLRLGNQVGTQAWDDLVHAEHERAFVVAGAMKADLLADLGKAVERAIGESRSLEAFRAEFKQIVADRGWHGWTGEGTAKGEAWRTKVIYRTNMATSYAAGRMAQLVAGKFKFWIYKHGNSLEPRLQHLAWDGLVLTPDDPFWQTHAPPNGWGCTCRIRGANGPASIKAVKGDPGKKLPDGWQDRSLKTGVPEGIDKGWDYAPGVSVADEIIQTLQAKVAALPAKLGSDLGATLTSSVDASWSKWVADTVSSGGRAQPGFLGSFTPAAMKVLELNGKLPRSAEVLINPGLLAGPKAKRHQDKGDALSVADWTNLPERFRNPTAILVDTRSQKLLFITSADAGQAQLAIDLAYTLNGAAAQTTSNLVVSAYRPVIAEVLRRIANKSLQLLWGSLG